MDAVELLRELLRCDTTNPPGNEDRAVEVLRPALEQAGLTTRVLSGPKGRPNLVATLEGPRDRPALVLVSHTDVVGVEPDQWSHDPFGGELADGAIWGRGALDMKSVTVMHANAVMTLCESGAPLNREIILCAVADEEAGGADGARWLLATHPEVVGFGDGRPAPEALGEGGFGISGLLDRPVMPVIVGEKWAVWLELRARGDPGHGSLPPQRQAARNLARVIDDTSGYRPPRVHPVMREQFRLLAQESSGVRKGVFNALASSAGPAIARALARPLRSSGAIAALLSDTVTPTLVRAGHKQNVVPGEATAACDCRLLPDTDPQTFVGKMQSAAAKNDVEIELVATHGGPVSDKGPLYQVLQAASRSSFPEAVVVPSLTPGITDLRYFRQRGAQGYGWVPLVLTPELLSTIHGHDERVPVDDLRRAVSAMSEAVRRAAT